MSSSFCALLQAWQMIDEGMKGIKYNYNFISIHNYTSVTYHPFRTHYQSTQFHLEYMVYRKESKKVTMKSENSDINCVSLFLIHGPYILHDQLEDHKSCAEFTHNHRQW